MITLQFLNHISANLTEIVGEQDMDKEASAAFLDFFALLSEDDQTAYIGNLLYMRAAIKKEGGGDTSSLITDDFVTSHRLGMVNDELMSQLDILFYMACIRQKLKVPSNMRNDLLILLFYTDNHWDLNNIAKNPIEAGHGFYALVKNMMTDQ